MTVPLFSRRAAAFAALILLATAADAQVRITEVMFEGTGLASVEFKGNGTLNPKIIDDKREFFEITNLGSAAVDVRDWVYNDDKVNDPIAFGNAFGSLAAGESAILTEMSASSFRALWQLDATVKVFSIGGLSNLGKNDTIWLYDAQGKAVDQMSYPVGFGASGVSYNLSAAALAAPVNLSVQPGGKPDDVGGALNSQLWTASALGDGLASHQAEIALSYFGVYNGSTIDQVLETQHRHDVANPGRFMISAVPEPGSWLLMGLGLLGLAGIRTGRRRSGA